ncbi:MAG: hypothetical protein LBH20_04300 [Treponema sp.]|jgi:hypothetical protein|nr:hypothetical protein [Treponema sp.]
MKWPLLPLFLFFAIYAAGAQEHDPGYSPEVIRGEVWVELAPIYGNRPDIEYPLSRETAGRRALQEAALYFSGMIYGWSFHYDIGEKARGITEDFDIFEPMGEIRWGDPCLSVTEIENRDTQLRIWTDYRMSEVQQKRMQVWRAGTIRNAQGMGYCPLTGPSPDSGWQDIRNAVLKDAARVAIRAMLRGSERNRPKEAAGFISLASFPRFFIDSGQWAVSARFRVQVNEIVPFAVY